MNLKAQEVQILIRLGHLFLYFVLVFAFIFSIHFLAKVYGSVAFDENSWVENIQLALLCISVLVFCGQVVIFPAYRAVLLFLMCCCLFACCRELDATLDALVPVLHWKFAYIFPLSAFTYIWKFREKARKQFCDFFNMPAFYLMFLAVVLVIPVAQCIGHGTFVKNVLGINKVADIKELFEETTEAVGYFLILLSSIEMYYNVKSIKVKK